MDSLRSGSYAIRNAAIHGMELTDLDELCLDNILKFLTPNDLAAMSLTCFKYKMLAERFFDLHCKTRPITLTYCSHPFSIQFKIDTFYEQCFHSLVRFIDVSPTLIPDNSVFEFIRDRCNKRLLSLELTGGADEDIVGLIEINGAIIEDQLKNLEKLRMNQMPYRKNYENLLQYCHNLRSLFIDTAYLDIPWDNAWTNKIYSKLETLQLYVDDSHADLTTFFQLNPNVKTVCCLGNASIKSICCLKSRLQRVMAIFGNFTDFHKVKDVVEAFCRRNNFQKFELAFPEFVFSIEQIHTVMELPNISAFHCTDKAILQIIEEKYTLSRMEKLCIYDRYRSLKSYIYKMEEHFPNLRELRIFLFEKDFPLTALFKQFQQLNQIYLGRYNEMELRYSTNDIVQWNNSRSQLSNASKLIIYLPSNIFETFNEQIIGKEFIQVKPWMEEYCECLAASEFDHRHGVSFPEIDDDWRNSSQDSGSG